MEFTERPAGLLANWFDIDDGAEAFFNFWHTREHVIERLGVPGFVRGRRYVSLDRPAETGHGYFVMYDTQELAVLESPAYAQRLDAPTKLTRQVVPTLRNMTRTAYERAICLGGGIGAYAMTVRPEGLALSMARDGERLRQIAEAVYAEKLVTAVSVCIPDAAVTHFKDKTQEGQATETKVRADYPCCFIVEACDPRALEAAGKVLKPQLETAWPEGAPALTHSYQLIFAMQA